MFLGKITIVILPRNIVNFNSNITLESLSINDLLGNIEFLTGSIISKKDKNEKI